jgi:Carbon dioxide concentrating mechanism/carboxysome shell protein
MKYGRVIGNVVSTIKNEKLKGVALLIVEPLDTDGNVIGNSEIVGDFLGAGVGDLVIWAAEGDIICRIMGVEKVPLRGSIVGIIDKIDMVNENKVITG